MTLRAAVEPPSFSAPVTLDEYYQAALVLYKQANYDEAFKYYQASAQANPKNYKAYQSMGHCMYRTERLGEALAYYEKALALYPENIELKKLADMMMAAGVRAPSSSGSPAPPVPGAAPAAPQTLKAIPFDPNKKWNSYGIKVGATMAQPVGDNLAGTKGKIGLTGGAFFALGLSPRLAVRPELLVVQKNYGINISTSTVMDMGPLLGSMEMATVNDYKINAMYIELPILVSYALTPSRSFTLFAGPVPGFLMSAKETGTTTFTTTYTPPAGEPVSVSTPMSVNVDLKPYYASTSVCAAGGFGVQMGKLLFEARYSMGLTSLYKTGKFKYNTLSAMLGYSF